ncbi:hypothetical protein DFQ26_004466 [Actinomortierella ambigua]|nr:hypothetical protein DFQ26_004466 [Actinomortierella ambigua]
MTRANADTAVPNIIAFLEKKSAELVLTAHRGRKHGKIGQVYEAALRSGLSEGAAQAEATAASKSPQSHVRGFRGSVPGRSSKPKGLCPQFPPPHPPSPRLTMTHLLAVLVTVLAQAILQVCAMTNLPQEGAYRLGMGTLYLSGNGDYIGAPLRFGSAIESRLWQLTAHGNQFHIQSSDFGFFVGYEASEPNMGLILTKKPKAAWELVQLDNGLVEIHVPGKDLVMGQLPSTSSLSSSSSSSSSSSLLDFLPLLGLTIPDKEGTQAWRFERFALTSPRHQGEAPTADMNMDGNLDMAVAVPEGDYEILQHHRLYLQHYGDHPGSSVLLGDAAMAAARQCDTVWRVRNIDGGSGDGYPQVTIQNRASGLYLGYDSYEKDDVWGGPREGSALIAAKEPVAFFLATPPPRAGTGGDRSRIVEG